MATLATTPTTQGKLDYGWYRGRKCATYVQRVNCTHGSFLVPLQQNVPAKARVISASLQNVIVPTVTGTAAAVTANSIALVMFPTSSPAVTAPLTSSPATVTVKGVSATITTFGVFTQGCLLAQTPGIGTSESNGVYRGAPIISRVNTTPHPGAENPMPVAALLAVVPANLSSNTLQINGTAITSGFCFGTGTDTSTNIAATVDATLYMEIYDDYPTF